MTEQEAINEGFLCYQCKADIQERGEGEMRLCQTCHILEARGLYA
jgi:transcription initiation factor IIE alpha subunit